MVSRVTWLLFSISSLITWDDFWSDRPLLSGTNSFNWHSFFAISMDETGSWWVNYGFNWNTREENSSWVCIFHVDGAVHYGGTCTRRGTASLCLHKTISIFGHSIIKWESITMHLMFIFTLEGLASHFNSNVRRGRLVESLLGCLLEILCT